MCNICAQFRVADDCPYEGEAEQNPTHATVTESGEAAGNTSTSSTMSAGDTFEGNLFSQTDIDWIEIDLTSGMSYDFAVTAANGSAFVDSVLALYDGSGSYITGNDDIDYGGGNYFSGFDYTAIATGTYYVSVTAYDLGSGTNFGDYDLTVSAGTPSGLPENGSIQELADYLREGFWTDNGGLERAFSSNTISFNYTDLNATERSLATAAMDMWEMVADISFSQTAGSADILFLNDEDGDDTSLNAYAITSTSGTSINDSEIVISSSWVSSFGSEIGTYGFQTYVHEIGHAIGLGHQSNYNGSASFPTSADFGNDSWQVSIMSYFSQQDNTLIDDDYAYLLTSMMADVLAIQDIYGAATTGSATAGDTIWGAGSNLGNFLDDVFADFVNGAATSYSGDPVTFTIFDADGEDTIDLSFAGDDSVIDLNDGTFSDIGGAGIGTIGIAVGTLIENFVSGAGDDTIVGNEADNLIEGGNGQDTIEGGAGDDTLDGGRERDTVRGGEGNDILYGYLSHDRLYGDAGNDKLYGSNGSDYMKGGDGHDYLVGGRQADSIFGGAGNDQLRGGSEDDKLRGEGGNDKLYGQAGSDRFIFADNFGSDTIFDFEADNGEQIDLSDVTAITDYADLVANHLSETAGGSAEITDGINVIRISDVGTDALNADHFIF